VNFEGSLDVPSVVLVRTALTNVLSGYKGDPEAWWLRLLSKGD
jgi:hypothetical protein